MSSPRTRFYLDKQNSKWSGVCAGIADYTGIDVTLVRIGVVGLTFLTGPWTIPAYFITAWMAPRKPLELYAESREELLRHGRIISRPQRAWLGVFAHPLEEGIVVAGVVPDGPGARSGVQEGDVIVALDSQEVPTRKELYQKLWRHGPGEKIALEVLRDNELRVVHVTGGDRAEFYKQR